MQQSKNINNNNNNNNYNQQLFIIVNVRKKFDEYCENYCLQVQYYYAICSKGGNEIDEYVLAVVSRCDLILFSCLH